MPPAPDEWMRRLGTLPLLYQPGERWLYNTGSDVLGVLDRQGGRSAARRVPPRARVRLRSGWSTPASPRRTSTASARATRRDPETGEPVRVRPARRAVGQAAGVPVRVAAASSPRSTTCTRSVACCSSGGRLPDGSRLLSRASVEAMTTDHIGAAAGAPGPSPDGSQGWGFGVGVQVRRTGLVPTIGTYGWAGGLGTSWANDPTEGIVGVVLTTDTFAVRLPAAGDDPRLLDLCLRVDRRLSPR